ncbi:OpgC domain-containing protein [Shimia sp. R9_1]|uniref:OpgC family protein n=1 Tax=Shimia sp. R9_1 TaxID=2821111 RepID=UPI001ADC0740|nr:OpgC domain-containing protein [Shimia sp. R9_1]MBO9409260.1 OpgC domain-containing protein [Shimia sp. R9_1]
MRVANPTFAPAPAAVNTAAQIGAKTRDIRLDFFRGIAMFIILIAHVPGNWLTLWIPARFGFSDATEIFVFCSGMASALAFGRVFREQGNMMGTVRISYRVWQIYWAHICLFFAIATAMVALNALLPEGRNYVGQLNLHPFFKDTPTNLLGLLTLTYVPNYFDILPMYMVILVMLPAVVILAKINKALAFAAVVAVWLCANLYDLNFPAEPWSERHWFFNPFGWQLIFFTGFALNARWLPAPPVDNRLFLVAVAVLLITLPFAYFRLYNELSWALEWRKEWRVLIDKTNFGILRYVHFLSLAYVAWVLAGRNGDRLQPRDPASPIGHIWQRMITVILKVGQQSLAVFIASMFLARLMGALLDQVGRTHFTMFWVNLLGAAIIVGVAYGASYYKSQPWKKRSGANAKT